MAKKKWTWERLLKMFNPDNCTISASVLVCDGISFPIKAFDRKMFDEETLENDGTAEVQTLTGKIIFRKGPFVKVNVEGEIIEVELK